MLNYKLCYKIRGFGGSQTISGDNLLIIDNDDSSFIVHYDMAGHGKKAYEASKVCEEFLRKNYEKPLVSLVTEFDQFLRKNHLECVAFFGRLHKQEGKLNFINIGNITLRKYGRHEAKYIPRGGVLGYVFPKPLDEDMILLHRNEIFMSFSDGIKSGIPKENLLALLDRPPKEIAAEIIENYSRKDDDSSCLVIKVT